MAARKSATEKHWTNIREQEFLRRTVTPCATDNSTLDYGKGNSTDIEKEYGDSNFLLIVGSLGLTMIVVLAALSVLVCQKLNNKLRKRKAGPVRMASNSDFSFRVSDVLERRKYQTPTPRKSRHASYFRQESYEATRFDRTVPYKCQTIPENHNNTPSGLLPDQDLHQNTSVPNKRSRKTQSISTNPLSDSPKIINLTSESIPSDEINNSSIPTNVLPKNLKNNDYQVPSAIQHKRTYSKSHYQTPANHYQTPKSPGLPRHTIYHTPKSPSLPRHTIYHTPKSPGLPRHTIYHTPKIPRKVSTVLNGND